MKPDISIYYGIKTGYNPAFVVDDETKASLIAEDAKSSEILKPILRGRDIKRYRAQWAGLWLISTIPARHIDIDDYPAVRRHLSAFGRERLAQTGTVLADGTKSRKRTPHQWFELQDTCVYHAQFDNEKLFWIDLSDQGRFAYDSGEMMCVNTVYMMTGTSMKYLCAVLNSTLITWFANNVAVTSGMGTPRWFSVFVQSIPIPMIPASKQSPLARLVDEIVDLSAASWSRRRTAQQQAIDRLIYDLYTLSQDEVGVVKSTKSQR